MNAITRASASRGVIGAQQLEWAGPEVQELQTAGGVSLRANGYRSVARPRRKSRWDLGALSACKNGESWRKHLASRLRESDRLEWLRWARLRAGSELNCANLTLPMWGYLQAGGRLEAARTGSATT